MKITKISSPFCVASQMIGYKRDYNINNSVSFTSKPDSFESTSSVKKLSKKDCKLIDNILLRENSALQRTTELMQDADEKSQVVLETSSDLLKIAAVELAKKNSRNTNSDSYEIKIEFSIPGESNKCSATYTSYNETKKRLFISTPSEIAGKTNNYCYLGKSFEDLRCVLYEEGYSKTEPAFSNANVEIQFDDNSDWVKFAKRPVYTPKSRKSEEFLYKSHNAITYYKDLEYFKPFIYEGSKKAKTEVILNKDLSLRSYGEDYDFNEYREINYYSVFHFLEPVGRIYAKGVTSRYDYSTDRELHAKNEFCASEVNKWLKL